MRSALVQVKAVFLTCEQALYFGGYRKKSRGTLELGKRKYRRIPPFIMDTRLIRTPCYYEQFSLPLGKVHIFSLNSTCLIRTPVTAQTTSGPPFFLSETRARVKITPREKGETRWGELIFLPPHRVSPFSHGMIYTRARVLLALLSLRKNG